MYQRLSFIAGPPERYDRNGNAWMLDPERAGGGCLANLGPHFVDLFLQRSANTTAESPRGCPPPCMRERSKTTRPSS